MRLLALLGCVLASTTGCETMRSSTKCSPCLQRPAGCPVAPPSAPTPGGKPAVLPPTIREVRGPSDDAAEPRTHAAAANQDVLLIPRWVYVPYSPHVPNGQMKLAGGSGSPSAGPYMQVDDRVTVLPAMGSTSSPSHSNETLEQCLHQMKLLNARIGELESKTTTRPVMVAPIPPPAAPQLLPLPPIPVPMIPPAK